jgi:hypothetical protein
MVECEDCGGYYSESRIGAHRFAAHGQDRRKPPADSNPTPPPDKGAPKSKGSPAPTPTPGEPPKKRTMASRWSGGRW